VPLGPPIVISGVFRVAFEWFNATNGQKAVNVMCFENGAGTVSGLFSALNSNVTAGMWRSVNLQFAITSVKMLPLDGVSPTTPESPTGAQWKTNFGVDNGYETQNAAIVSLRTAFRGPQARGRVYLPATDEAFSNAGAFDATAQASMQTAWTNFVAAMSASGYVLCVASRKHLTFHQVTTVQVEGLMATQRRRQQRLRRT